MHLLSIIIGPQRPTKQQTENSTPGECHGLSEVAGKFVNGRASRVGSSVLLLYQLEEEGWCVLTHYLSGSSGLPSSLPPPTRLPKPLCPVISPPSTPCCSQLRNLFLSSMAGVPP